MKDEDIINGLGGSTKLARRLGYNPQRVNNWKVRGIPTEVLFNHPHIFKEAIKTRRERKKQEKAA